MYHVFETKSNPGMGIANISVDNQNATNTNKHSPRNSTTPANPSNNQNTNAGNNTNKPAAPPHQRKISSTSTTTLPVPKQPTNTPATPKPAFNNSASSPSLLSNRPALNAPNRNSGYQPNISEEKAEVNLQMNKNQVSLFYHNILWHQF